MKARRSESYALPIVGQSEANEEETVDVTLYDMQRGRDVKAVHRHDGDRLNSYAFRVLDDEWNVCAHRGSDEPPIGVVQAVARFGYRVHNARSYPLAYADVRHLCDILETLTNVHSTSSDPLLRGLLSHATLAVSFGTSVLNLRATLVDNHGEDAFDEALVRFDDRYGGRKDELTLNEARRELTKVATDGGRLPSEDPPHGSPMAGDDLTIARLVNRQWTGGSMVSLEPSEVDGDRKLLVTAFGSHHVDRYDFDVLDREEKTCVFRRDDSRGRPPTEVVEEVRRAGYEIDNIPVLSPTDSVRERLAAVDRLLDDINQSYEAGSYPYEALKRGQTLVQEACSVAAIRATEPERYVDALARAVYESTLVESAEELESVSWADGFEDFLYERFTECLDLEMNRPTGEFEKRGGIF